MGGLLAISLSAAVPLRIAEYRERGGPTPEDRERVRTAILRRYAAGGSQPDRDL